MVSGFQKSLRPSYLYFITPSSTFTAQHNISAVYSFVVCLSVSDDHRKTL